MFNLFEQQAKAIESVKQLTETPKKRKQVTCYCEAYSHPHRMHGGQCNGYQPKETGYTSLETLEKMSGMTAKDFK
ncbi:MAG: hypothetical protein RLZZ469_1672 [Bacteroidota bacterium]|jgi:hypothetical protein